ncbi:hypothetical protein HK104_006183, partial [Borealophlyctis nickersoniae]
MDASELHAFLRPTGPTLESFSMDFWDEEVGVHPNPGDRVLECLRESAPNLRLFEICSFVREEPVVPQDGVVTEEGVLTFMQASRKLRYMYPPNNLARSERIHDAAEERNVVVAYPHDVRHPYPYGYSPFPSYVELMKQ